AEQRAAKTPQEIATAQRKLHDFEVNTRYFLSTYAKMSDRTRSSIVSTLTAKAAMLSRGVIWELMCNELNLPPEVTYTHGKIIVLDIPVSEYLELGRVAQGLFKYAWQQCLLRRDVSKYPRPAFLWADEAQLFLTPTFDYQFLTV